MSVVNASQTPAMQAAQSISQVFMGVNLKCASCHDSFVNDWTLADAYGMASVYSDQTLELVHCDKPTGKIAAPKFIYAQLGELGQDGREQQVHVPVGRELRARGIAVIYISHFLEEVRQVADDVHVLRDGADAGRFQLEGVSDDELVRRMVGREAPAATAPRATPTATSGSPAAPTT